MPATMRSGGSGIAIRRGPSVGATPQSSSSPRTASMTGAAGWESGCALSPAGHRAQKPRSSKATGRPSASAVSSASAAVESPPRQGTRTAGRVLLRDSPAIDRDHPARRRSDFESGHGQCLGRTSYRSAAAVHAARGQLGSSRCRDQCAGWTGVRAASTGHLRESRGQARPFPIGEAGRRAERFCRWDLPPVLEGCGRGGRHDVSRSRRRGSTASVSAYVSRRYTRLCDYAL